MNRIFFAGAALAAVAATAAIAQAGGDRFHRDEPLTRAAVQAAVQAKFAESDADRDGFVTGAEARARAETARGEHRAGLFERLDADRDGSISRAEFDAHHAGRGERHEGRRGRRGGHGGMARPGLRRFAAMDADHDGRVSLAEASGRALAMFDRADANRDGTVTADERRAAREAFRGQRRERRGS
jgi:EF hand domain-containing protein